MSQAPYEEVRRKLRERGYLDGRIERFVLGDLARSVTRRGRLALAALRAAFLGGPLVGALVAGSAAAANRPLLGWADLLLLWLYLALAASIALFILDLAAAAVVAAWARRRGSRSSDAVKAGLLVAVPILVHLVLLWRSRGIAGGWAADLAFLAVATMTLLLVGWLAGLVSLAGIVGRTGEVPDRARRAALPLVLALLPVGGGCLAALGWLGGPAGPREAAPFEVRGGAGRILWIGIDGLDLATIETTGSVALSAAVDRGALFPLRATAGAEPPEAWTTLITGTSAAEHGVRSAGAERLPGVSVPLGPGRPGSLRIEAALRLLLPTKTVPASGAARAVRTVWEIVALREPALAVGWWASWPAGQDAGVQARGRVVTDRVLPKLLSGGSPDRDTHPASLFDRLEQDFEGDRQNLARSFEETFPHPPGDPVERWIWESFLIDAYSFDVAARLWADPELRAGFVYLPGLDILRHRFGPESGGEVSARAVSAYVRWLDGLLAPALGPGGTTSVVLVGDPGRRGIEAPRGFVLVLGGAARAGCQGPTLDPLDVAPLTLALLGYPASAEMGGAIPGGCLDERLRGLGRIPTFGRRDTSGRDEPTEYDAELLQRLKSLGYLN